ncbi:TPA: hypothetical protein LA742_001084 [Clostridium botulinum]|nr:hypothetical protein [Clostridium botulinum]
MSIGISANVIEKILRDAGIVDDVGSVPASIIRDAIIKVIEENNKEIEKNITKKMASDLMSNIRNF